MNIRPLNPTRDHQALRACVIDLQNYERDIDQRMPSGESIIEEYLAEMALKNSTSNGTVLIAEVEEIMVGYVQILCNVATDSLEDGEYEYGLVSDLYVRSDQRGAGVGKGLLSAAEQHAVKNGVRWLRIAVMASNTIARNAYLRSGFSELYVELEKELNNP